MVCDKTATIGMVPRWFKIIRRGIRIRSVVKFVVIGVAAALIRFQPPAAQIERSYSGGIYVVINSWLARLSNLVPFAIGDILLIALIIGLPAGWILRLASAGRGRRVPAFTSLVLDTLALGAAVYLTFLVLWGLNYSREPLTSMLDYEEQRITPEASKRLLLLTIQELNADSALAHERPWPSDEEIRQVLYPSFEATIRDLGNRTGITPAIPKTSLLGAYFEATGVTGFTDPFTHEVILNATLLPFEKPFILAHEWGHLAGFARESEANFVALLACARSDVPVVRYSGWLALYSNLVRSGMMLPPLSPQVAADLRAIRERERRHVIEQVSRAERRVYDQFLKANRVEEGVGNYGLFVRLVLGTRFKSNWVPVRRAAEAVPVYLLPTFFDAAR